MKQAEAGTLWKNELEYSKNQSCKAPAKAKAARLLESNPLKQQIQI